MTSLYWIWQRKGLLKRGGNENEGLKSDEEDRDRRIRFEEMINDR